ncbi:hypothetical protein GIB67_035806, partial [Kingdonia uniflora]
IKHNQRKRWKNQNLIRVTKAAIEITLIHPILQITNPYRLILIPTTRSSPNKCLLVLLLLWL